MKNLIELRAEMRDELLSYKRLELAEVKKQWLFTGLFGGHRAMLGHDLISTLMAITFGGFGIWWLIDWFNLPRITDAWNNDQEQREAAGQIAKDAEDLILERPDILERPPSWSIRIRETLKKQSSSIWRRIINFPFLLSRKLWFFEAYNQGLIYAMIIGSVSGITAFFGAIEVGLTTSVIIFAITYPRSVLYFAHSKIGRGFIKWDYLLSSHYHKKEPGKMVGGNESWSSQWKLIKLLFNPFKWPSMVSDKSTRKLYNRFTGPTALICCRVLIPTEIVKAITAGDNFIIADFIVLALFITVVSILSVSFVIPPVCGSLYRSRLIGSKTTGMVGTIILAATVLATFVGFWWSFTMDMYEPKPNDTVSAIFSPDNKKIFTKHPASQSVLVYDFEAKTELLKIGKVYSESDANGEHSFINWSSDSRRVLVGYDYDPVEVWDIETKKELFSFDDGVKAGEFSPDGKLIATSSDEIIKLWQAETGQNLTSLEGHQDNVYMVSWSPDSRKILTAATYNIWTAEGDRNVKVWDTVTGKELFTLKYQKDWVVPIGLNSSGDKILTISNAKIASIWDANSGREILTFRHQGEVTSAAWSPNGAKIVTISEPARTQLSLFKPLPRNVIIWDAKTGKEILTLIHNEAVRDKPVSWSPDGQKIVTCQSEQISVWDAETGKSLAILMIKSKSAESLDWSSDGRYILVGGDNSTVQVFDLETKEEVFSHRPYNQDID